MNRLERAIGNLSNGGSYQHEVLRFLEEIIEVLGRIEMQVTLTPLEIKLEAKEEKVPSWENVKVAKKRGRPFKKGGKNASKDK